MALFFIRTDTGQVATQKQLIEAGVVSGADTPPRPWFPIQGSRDATTMWYAVLRKQIRDGVFIGTVTIRHSDHHASLLRDSWEDISMDELREGVARA